jgi:hypothetical protein
MQRSRTSDIVSGGPGTPQFGRRATDAPEPGAQPESAAEKAAPNKRTSPRSRALLAGKLIVWDGQLSTDCMIRDLSDDGARVKVASTAVIPAEVGLLIIRDGLLLECRLVWRRGDEAGLSVLSRHDLNKSNDAAHRRARAIWLEVSPR